MKWLDNNRGVQYILYMNWVRAEKSNPTILQSLFEQFSYFWFFWQRSFPVFFSRRSNRHAFICHFSVPAGRELKSRNETDWYPGPTLNHWRLPPQTKEHLMPFFRWDELKTELITPKYSPARGPFVQGEKIRIFWFRWFYIAYIFDKGVITNRRKRTQTIIFAYTGVNLRARAKITLHYKRRCILPGGVAKARNMLDIPALSRLARQAPQRLKSVN